MKSHQRIGLIIQGGSIIVSLIVFWYNWILGLVFLIPAIFANLLTQATRKDINGLTIKLLLLFQSILILFVITNQMTSNNDIDSLKDKIINNYNKNRFIQNPLIGSEKKHTYRIESNNESINKHHDIKSNSNNNAHNLNTNKNDNKYHHITTQRQTDINNEANNLFIGLFDEPFVSSDFSDIRYRSSEEVRSKVRTVFEQLPQDGFMKNLKNPCWYEKDDDQEKSLACLPYAYILGQPKCGTSNLFEHLKKHPEIVMPRRKEVRWFTRGEFTLEFMQQEVDRDALRLNQHELRIGPGTSIYTFTRSFDTLSTKLQTHSNDRLITVDGGPHTFWWPTQNSDGTLLPEDVPPTQIIREMQPNAKFIITLSDPVKRLYSDYYFLQDNLRPVKAGIENNHKSADELHDRVVMQISEFQYCLEKNMNNLINDKSKSYKHSSKAPGTLLWMRASQICAHDRSKFGKAGWGRLSIGLYSLYMIKWLEFHVVRLEDYDTDPKAYMKKIFNFLELSEPDETEWNMITFNSHINENRIYREPIRDDTEKLLRDFYEPYNVLLSKILNDDKFKWSSTDDLSLREQQQKEATHTAVNEHLSSEQRKMEIIKQRSLQKRHDMMMNHRLEEEGLGQDHNHLGDPENQHGIARHVNDSTFISSEDFVRRERDRVRFLRGQENSGVDLQFRSSFRPGKLDIEDLPRATTLNAWFTESPIIATDKNGIKNREDAAQQLCSAAFGLDLYALEHLLYDVGIPSDVTLDSEGSRNAFHCLSLISHIADSHARSHIFSLLKGKLSWLSEYIKPAMERKLQSVASYEILSGLNDAIVNTAKWLLKAGVNINQGDSYMNTPLHYAAQGGLESLVDILLTNGADPNVVNTEARTPLHFAAAYGHASVAAKLIKSGGDASFLDNYGSSPNNIISSPGPILKAEAEEILGITQREPKKIERKLHPELLTESDKGYWVGGTGGWGSERKEGFEEDMECDIDQYWADEITGEEVFNNYIANNAPVLIRGLISSWPAIETYSYANLSSRFGAIRVQVSDIPYAQKFGGSVSTDMLLSEYIEEVKDHKIIGESHPWYVFRGHPIPNIADGPGSFVSYDDCPTPRVIYDAFKFLKNPRGGSSGGPRSRDNFINAQWAFGGEGTGAPVHFHNTAWNALVYGAKKWLVYPPHYKIMSSKQILDFYETDMKNFKNKGIKPLTCIQTAGDVMIIPESWGHGVLNIQESIAVATEAKYALWRVKSPIKIMNSLPSDNREDYKKRGGKYKE